MPISVTLNLVAAVALAVGLKIFIYLYLSNRVRFFRYVVWAWGCYAGSKTLQLAHDLMAGVPALVGTAVGLSAIGDFLILASALALRWSYSIRPLQALVVAVYALSVARYGSRFGLAGVYESGGIVSGVVLLLSALAFWPRRQTEGRLAGQWFLAAAIAAWGLHHVVAPLVAWWSELAFVASNVTNALIYYIVVFPVVIVVLDRARGEAAALKEFNERLIDGLGEGLQLAHIVSGAGLGPAPLLGAQKNLAEIEKAYIIQTLERCAWNHSRAADALGIARTTLWRKLKDYGLER